MTITTNYNLGDTVRCRRPGSSKVTSFRVEQIQIRTLGSGLILVEYRRVTPPGPWYAEKYIDQAMREVSPRPETE